MNRNQAVQEHNNDVATQISNLKSSQTTGDVVQGGLQAVQQFWSGGKMPNEITAVQEHFAKGGTLFSNPTTQAQVNAQKGLSDTATKVGKMEENPPTLTDEGDGIFSSVEGAEEGLGSTALKGLSGITAVATGAMDIYKDIEAGGIAGDNWASKTSNILQIGGAIADLGGTVFPPLALIGGVTDVAAGVFGEVGTVKDEQQQQQDDTTLQQKETEQEETVSAPQTFTTGRVS
jgi:hypothetical protein